VLVISTVLFLSSCLADNRFTVLQRANHPPRKFQQSFATAKGRPDEKESRMLNRAFYGYDEFALFRSLNIVLIDLPLHDYTFHESFWDESAARNREMLIADSIDCCPLTMHRIKKFTARFVESVSKDKCLAGKNRFPIFRIFLRHHFASSSHQVAVKSFAGN